MECVDFCKSHAYVRGFALCKGSCRGVRRCKAKLLATSDAIADNPRQFDLSELVKKELQSMMPAA